MPEIVTDHDVLRKKSTPADDLEIGDIIQQLSITIPSNGLGLAAPQIGIHKQVFLAKLSTGSYAFINPEIIWQSPDKVPSEESCLSLPDIHRCVERHSQVKIRYHKLIDITTGDLTAESEIRLKNMDAIVVQHEIDHLNGMLIIDLPETMTREQRRLDKEQRRKEKIQQARLAKNSKSPLKPQKLSAKNIQRKKKIEKQMKKKERTRRRQERIRVEIAERYAAEQEGLFSNEASPDSERTNEGDQA